jgi:hypothetical protein
MVGKVKLYSQLDSLEDELRERIIPHLKSAAAGANDFVFSATDFKSSREPKFKVNAETDSLIQLGRQVLVLREKLKEPTENTIAERICWYCRKYENISGSQKKLVQELAQTFLDEIITSSTIKKD